MIDENPEICPKVLDIILKSMMNGWVKKSLISYLQILLSVQNLCVTEGCCYISQLV